MWQWFRRRIGGVTPSGTLVLGNGGFGTTCKGKSPIADAIAATGAQPGETVAIDQAGVARIIGRPLSVAVNNTADSKN